MSPIALDSHPGSPATQDVSANESSAQTNAQTWDEPIAIVGMGCRWPGSASSPSALWDLLQARTDTYSDFPESKLNYRGFYHPNKNRIGSFNTKGGYFLSEDPRLFDNAFFGITPLETITLDPAQRKLLEVTYEAFEAAGATLEKISASKTGVYIGNYAYDHQVMQLRDVDNPLPYMETGGATPILSNRISYVFNLLGPSLTVDTASSSSLYALHLACQALLSGDCDAAVAGGSNLILSPDIQIIGTKLGTLSPRSKCSTFDAAADGYGRSEGFGVLYLKRLSAAVKDGDPIRAVIRGTALNANGKTGGITHPSVDGQEGVIRAAYAAAGLSPSDTAYFECHGTGTAVGDPIEVSGLGRVFAEHRIDDEPLLIGAIKPNMGHSESAAGFAGVMKAVLAVEKGIIPPTIGVVKENPDIDFTTNKVQIVKTSTPWPSWSHLRRISINSFGYGGTNAHCIIESLDSVLPGYSHYQSQQLSLHSPNSNGHGEPQASKSLLVFSAHHSTTLHSNISSIATVAERYPIRNLAHTLSTKRTRFHERAFAVIDTSSPSSLSSQLSEAKLTFANPSSSASSKHSIGLVFTGQGAQWAQMGLPLLRRYPVFAQSIRDLDSILLSLPATDRPSWSLKSVLCAPPETSQINIAAIAQPICTALQIALVDLLYAWGIKATAAIGHSSGEIAAAYAAGLISAPEAIVTAYFRGKIVGDDMQVGAMMAVGLGADEVSSYLPDDVVVACINSPVSTTLSGTISSIETVKAALDEKQIFARVLKTGGKAYHSKMMANIGAAYEEATAAAIVALRNGRMAGKRQNSGVKMFSSVYGGKVMKQNLGPTYWRQNLESPVQFSKALDMLTADTELAVNQLIEIGPHSALNGPIRQIQQELEKNNGHSSFPAYLPSLVRNHDGIEAIMKLAGSLWAKDYSIDLEKVNQDFEEVPPVMITDLPTYKYNYDGPLLYRENRWHREWRDRKHLKHDVLGYRVPGCSREAPLWKNILRVKDVPWVEEHKIGSEMIFPAGGFLTMAIEAAHQLYLEFPSTKKITGYTLRNVEIRAALMIPENDYGIEVLYSCRRRTMGSADNAWEFQISSVNDDGVSTEHCRGSVTVETERATSPLNSVFKNYKTWLLKSEAPWYKAFHNASWRYGGSFQTLSNVRTKLGGQAATGTISMMPTTHLEIEEESSYLIHPATLETALQVGIIAAHGGKAQDYSSLFLPVSIDAMTLYPADIQPTEVLCLSTGNIQNPRSVSASAQLLTPTGDLLVNLSNTRFTASQTVLPSPRQPLRLAWKPDINHITNDLAQSMYKPIPFRSAALWEKIDRLAIHMLFDFHEAFASHIGECTLELPLQRFWEYITRMVDLGSQGKIPYGTEALNASTQKRKDTIEALCKEVIKESVVAELMERMYTHLEAIFRGTTTGQHVCFHDDLMTRFYIDSTTLEGAYVQLRRVMDLLGHQNPCRSVLELGAGTGGATRVVMDVLQGRSPMKRYKDYTFTDVSTYFLGNAQEEFSDCGDLTFKTIDFEKDPQYDGGLYDMVVASNCLHVGADMHQIMRHVRQFLKPGGKLVLVEVTNQRFWAPLLAGGFSDYWKGHDDGRINGPYCPREKWREVLVPANGYSGIDIMLDDYTDGHLLTSVILSTAIEDGPVSENRHEDEETNSEVNVNSSSSNGALVGADGTGIPVLSNGEASKGEPALYTDGGLPYISRFVLDESIQALSEQGKILETIVPIKDTRFCVSVDAQKPGLGGLYFSAAQKEKLKAEDIEVQVEAVGLDQQDFDAVLSKTSSGFLHEFAGKITRMGYLIQDRHLYVGARVVGLAPTKVGFGSHILANRNCVFALRPEEGFETIAAVPKAVVAVEYALRHVAGIEYEDHSKVLIHAVSGLNYAALAAIDIASEVQANVFVSVPDAASKEFVRQHCNFEARASNILTIEDLNTSKMMEVTNGEGFEVVYSLSTSKVEEIAQCMGPLGRWINATPAVNSILGNPEVSISTIDLHAIAQKKPKILGRLLSRALYHYRFFKLSAPKIESYPIESLATALSSSPSSPSVKSIVTYSGSSDITLRQTSPQFRCSSEASYILANCPASFARLLGGWLAEHGARSLTLLQLKESTDDIEQLKSEFSSAEVDITVVRDVDSAVGEATVQGVYFYTAEDVEIRKAIADLHAALQSKEQHLDFFITHSPTLSNDLDTFARHRCSLGLPSLSFTTDDTEELSLLRTFPLLFSPGPQQVHGENTDPYLHSRLHIPSPTPTQTTESDPRFSTYHQSLLSLPSTSSTTSGASASASERLAAAGTPEEYTAVATELLVEKLANLLFLPCEQVNTQKSLSDYGMDSMIAADLRSWMGKVFGVDLPFLELLSPEMKIWRLAERAQVKS